MDSVRILACVRGVAPCHHWGERAGAYTYHFATFLDGTVEWRADHFGRAASVLLPPPGDSPWPSANLHPHVRVRSYAAATRALRARAATRGRIFAQATPDRELVAGRRGHLRLVRTWSAAAPARPRRGGRVEAQWAFAAARLCGLPGVYLDEQLLATPTVPLDATATQMAALAWQAGGNDRSWVSSDDATVLAVCALFDYLEDTWGTAPQATAQAA